MVAQVIRERMAERTARLSWAIQATKPRVVQVERTQVVVCCGINGGGMGKTRFTCRAPRRHGRF